MDKTQSKPIEKRSQEKIRNVDDALKVIKSFGRYQIFIFFVYVYVCFPLNINSLFMGYGGLEPKWICNDPIANGSFDPNPTDNCEVYKKCSPENLTFVSEFYSVASEWALVCDKAYFVSLITSVQMVGQLIGSLSVGPISDLFGRKWIYFTVISLDMLLAGLAAVSNSPVMFLAFRFATGLCTGDSGVIAWIFTAETTTNRYRFLMKMTASVFLAYWNQLLIVYVTKNWRWYSIVANLEGLPILILLAFFAYESPRWLIQKGRIEKATHVLLEIARINKTEQLLPEKLELESESKGDHSKKYFAWDLFRTKRLAILTSVCVFNWFGANVAFYGMFFNLGNLSSDVYRNSAILAAILMLELPLGFFDTLSKKSNRKYMMVSFFILAAICDVLIVLLQTVIPKDVSGILLILVSSIGQVATQSAVDLCYIYAVELFPTLLRSNAQGLMSMAARVGGVIAPQLVYAGRFWAPLPYVCFAVISVLVAIADILFLPDTRHMSLPETYQQAGQNAVH